MQSRSDDFPLPLALLILGLVVGFLLLGRPLLSGELPWPVVEKFLDQNSTLLLTTAVLLIFNLSSLIGGVQRWIGFRKQGSRLKSIRGERPLFTKELLIRFIVSLSAGSLTYAVLSFFKIGELRWH